MKKIWNKITKGTHKLWLGICFSSIGVYMLYFLLGGQNTDLGLALWIIGAVTMGLSLVSTE